jgi:hypothetical protein
MRIRTLAGVAVAGVAAAAAVVGGVAVATADEQEPIVRIVQEAQPGDTAQQPGEDCPEKNGDASAPQGSGL